MKALLTQTMECLLRPAPCSRIEVAIHCLWPLGYMLCPPPAPPRLGEGLETNSTGPLQTLSFPGLCPPTSEAQMSRRLAVCSLGRQAKSKSS